MSYPVQQPGYPVAPQGYEQPAAPQGYPAQQPGYPAPPQAFPQQFQQGYPQPPMAPQGYPQQPPAPPLPAGSLSSFYSQPSVGGGAALKFQIGTTHVFMVARKLTDADVQPQTQPNSNVPATYRDGRQKFVMKVPARVAVTAEHPEGTAQWYCQGANRDLLAQSMATAGAPEGPPQAGSVIVVTKTGERPIPGFSSKAGVFTVQYLPPGPQADQYAQQCGISLDGVIREDPAAPAAPAAPAPVAQGVDFSQLAQPPAAPPAPPAPVAYQPPAPPQVPAPAAPALPPPPPAPAAMPAELANDPEKAALLARLTNQAPAPAAG